MPDRDSKGPNRGEGATRRDFLALIGVGAAGLAVRPQAARAAQETDPTLPALEMTPITLNINGRKVRLLVEPRMSLLHVLRYQLGLTGTKEGCDRGECGACTVLIDDIPRYACMTLAVEAQGQKVTTLEGLMRGEDLGPTQQAFLQEDGFQCGYCTPGQIMATEGLLRKVPDPDLEEIQRGLSGNLCRCGAYPHIFASVATAAELKKKG